MPLLDDAAGQCLAPDALPNDRRLDLQDGLDALRIDRSAPGKRRRRVPGRLIALMVVLAAVAAVIWRQTAMPTTVETGKALYIRPSQTLTLLTASGYVQADRDSSLATKASGRLVTLNVEEGSRVKAGEIVAELEKDDIIASRDQARYALKAAEHDVAKAQAEYKDASRNYKRMQALAAKDYVAMSDNDAAVARFEEAQASLDSAKATVQTRKAALAEAEANLEYAVIRAPFDGVILTKNADVGDIITPVSGSSDSKAAVVTIADMNSLQVEADVSESSIGMVKTGQPCEITLVSIPDETFPGHVHMIVPTADSSTATILVKIRFDRLDPRILPEMSAKAAFLEHALKPGEDQPRLAVNASALTQKNGGPAVFRLRGGKAELVPVIVGAAAGGMVEIISGLSEGEQVVLNPSPSLKNGQRAAARNL